ncbi:hypothetical protein VTJ83DRAFT_6865 [Remersonia thermophila]|uniref:Uncharacterized protein n=1 Tax=Remersonia thermophila TaxID=72144 RepID=A0ABR4D5X4_9PEZI
MSSSDGYISDTDDYSAGQQTPSSSDGSAADTNNRLFTGQNPPSGSYISPVGTDDGSSTGQESFWSSYLVDAGTDDDVSVSSASSTSSASSANSDPAGHQPLEMPDPAGHQPPEMLNPLLIGLDGPATGSPTDYPQTIDLSENVNRENHDHAVAYRSRRAQRFIDNFNAEYGSGNNA